MASKKPVAKPKATKEKSRVDNDPLADLGLTEEPAAKPAAVKQSAAKPPVEKEAAPTTNGHDTAKHDEVEVGDIEFGFSDFIPSAKRKPEGSKYKFDQLPAPTEKDGKPRIANFRVKLQPGVDADKLRRSVQSATTQANKQGAAAGKYFISRSWIDEATGKFCGMIVYRTDNKPA